MKLVIVESPKKARTIAGFLGRGYQVAASMGHVRDLPAQGLGIDVARDFAPAYEVLPRASRSVAALRRAAAGADSILLATDPDREGEAIAWHLVQALRLPAGRYQRIAFHEISRQAIQDALAHPRALDVDLVDAQQARRILDRLVGYGLSPLLWQKVQRGTSAGRVQSVALRMVVDREREIAAFVPREYWTLDVRLRPEGSPASHAFLARLEEIDGRPAEVADEATARRLEHQLAAAAYQVRQTKQEAPTRQPPPPFTTSTLQQTAGNRLRLPAKRTMAIAQALYEAGLVTYMRTDSVAVSAPAIAGTRRLIEATFGTDYVPTSPRRYRTKTKNAQEAHEAIRPVDVERSPAALRAGLPPDEWRLYELIWKRMVASQMAPARYRRDIAIVDGLERSAPALAAAGTGARSAGVAGSAGDAGGGARRFVLRAAATTMIFPGWLALYGQGAGEGAEADTRGSDVRSPGAAGVAQDAPEQGIAGPHNARLPQLRPGQPLLADEVLPGQHFTQPPPHFSEASLVKALEEAGVGRPSTYATVVSTIQDRGYVDVQQRQLRPTDLGCAASDFLVQHFPRIVDLPFTAEMEDALDEIAGGRRSWTAMLGDFYAPFAETVARAKGALPVRLPAAATVPPRGRPARPAAGGPAARSGGTTLASGSTRRRGAAPGGTPTRRTPGTPGTSGTPRSARTSPAANGTAAATSPQATATVAVLAEATPCPECGRPLVARVSQFGPFVGCSGYPACRYVHRDPGSLGRTPPRRARKSTAATPPARPARRPRQAPPGPLTANVIPAGSRRRKPAPPPPLLPGSPGSPAAPAAPAVPRPPADRSPAPRASRRSPAPSPRGSRSAGNHPANPAG